jgi:hypothetical protein
MERGLSGLLEWGLLLLVRILTLSLLLQFL